MLENIKCTMYLTVCPECDSSNVEIFARRKIETELRCRRCKHVWHHGSEETMQATKE